MFVCLALICWDHWGSYTVVLRWGVVMIMAFSQLQSQGFQSLQLVQSCHALLDKRHHPERDGGGEKKKTQDDRELAAGD